MAGYVGVDHNGNRFCIDYADGEGGAVIKGQQWKWEYTDSRMYIDITFYKVVRRVEDDGEVWYEDVQVDMPWYRSRRRCHSVWKRFNQWFKRYERRRKKAKHWETVKV